MPSFEPDAALVNYYAAGETLGGHSDDVEADLSKPIVSISLGCDAIFLQGGESITKAEMIMESLLFGSKPRSQSHVRVPDQTFLDVSCGETCTSY